MVRGWNNILISNEEFSQHIYIGYTQMKFVDSSV